MTERERNPKDGVHPVDPALAEVKFLTVAEVAAVMRVSNMTVYRMVHAGDLPAVRVGRSFRLWSAATVRAGIGEVFSMGSVIKKRRKRMAKKKHRKLLKKTRVQRRNKK